MSLSYNLEVDKYKLICEAGKSALVISLRSIIKSAMQGILNHGEI